MIEQRIVGSIAADTLVTFPQGSVRGSSRILHAETFETTDGPLAVVVTQQTPFHPVSRNWPDQPGDTGIITVGPHVLTVVDCITGAVDLEHQTLLLGEGLRARRGEPGWAFVVAHVVLVPACGADALLGRDATLEVDVTRRHQLSSAHSACHLAALALNKATRDLWRKDAPRDSIGNPDFDQLAIVESRILLDGSMDRYRLGRSLRRRGFDSAALLARLDDIGSILTDQARAWLALSPRVTLSVPDGQLSTPRAWECELPDGRARVACGGTHLRQLGGIGSLSVSLGPDTDGSQVVMRTTVRSGDPSG